MPTAGLDQNRIPGPDREPLAVQFHFTFTFKDVIYFRCLLVIVNLRVHLDLNDME